MTRYAEHCLCTAFPDYQPFKPLPAVVADWLQSTMSTSDTPQTVYVRRDQGRLRFRSVAGLQDGEILISVERQLPMSRFDRLRALGVSRREAEILFWVAQGKSNAEIGITLNISPRTVSTHLETIFKKLGINSRTTAAVVAVECLLDAR